MKTYIKKITLILLSLLLLLFSPFNSTFASTTTSMKSSSTISALPELNNNYPIVMVHGLFGWGNNELMGINYWGGQNSLKDLLTKNGYTVFTPTIGPISSSWVKAQSDIYYFSILAAAPIPTSENTCTKITHDNTLMFCRGFHIHPIYIV
jgi:triacylglycerol esterase/lipase EstA (alpha/beta hydrolase family)